jgi:hypothetical protein
MPRVVPSRVVRFITGNAIRPSPNGFVRMQNAKPGVLRSVLVLLDQIPDELLTMDDETYASFITAKEFIEEILETWTSNRTAGQGCFNFELSASHNPLEIIRTALVNCPDQSPAPATSELKFITDADLQRSLRNDIGGVTRALSNGEWKAATILAGSAIEALLLWSLSQHPQADITLAITGLLNNGELTRPPDPNLERWDLHEFSEVAANLKIIQKDTHIETRLAREFRNLIHPGRAQRLGQTCDRGTALASVAALDHVVRDLT